MQSPKLMFCAPQFPLISFPQQLHFLRKMETGDFIFDSSGFYDSIPASNATSSLRSRKMVSCSYSTRIYLQQKLRKTISAKNRKMQSRKNRETILRGKQIL
eukprot:TRINITY_DN58492_c0_g1_i1.p1 TRINITY_DN58492_c0_g1~~TRINITY_DN58492_c0_g1_i1.p1  ORF type:complete len:101 (-),score=8.29 TRINITY_DN58492_c0_g1_i1:220-522(-)